MNTLTHNVKIQHEKFGMLLNETFVDGIQFKLFLKMINGSLTESSDFTFFNGVDFLVHIPSKILKESIIITNLEPYTLTEHIINKSKVEGKTNY